MLFPGYKRVMIKFMFSKKLITALAQFFVTMIATVVFDLTIAIIIGVAFSCVMFIIQITRDTKTKIVGVDEKVLEQKHGITITKSLSHVYVAYLTGSVFFTTMSRIDAQLEELKARVLIFSMRGVPLVDASGVMGFYNLLEKLEANRCSLMLSGLQSPVMAYLKKAGVIDKIGEDMIFWSAEQAILRAHDFDDEPAPRLPISL